MSSLTTGTISYIGIGSNLERPLEQVTQAFEALRSLPDTQLLSHSSCYRSAALGPGDQPDYINAVAKLATQLPAIRLLEQLQQIEHRAGRQRLIRWEPRVLDLDILLFGGSTIASEQLQVPHPEMSKRNFVLYPLQEIEPSLIMPDGTPLSDLITKCPPNQLQHIATGNDEAND